MKNKKVTTICYGERQEWSSREEAESFFMKAIVGTEGSERDRYVDIVAKLRCGMRVCSDMSTYSDKD